jgi:gamma-glutamylcyclotransferase (GGCT)/AIG2-like uncharacterized protein YtfP
MSSEEDLRVFVYGTLRSDSQDYYEAKDGEADAHRRYLSAADFISPAKVRAQLFMVDYFPGMQLSDSDEWVVGEVYLLSNIAQLHQLDVYEGCSAHSPLPHTGNLTYARRDKGMGLYLYRQFTR